MLFLGAGDADCSVVPGSSFSPFLKMSVKFPFFQSRVIRCHSFSDTVESSLVTTSVSSLGTLRCTSAGPMGCVYLFLGPKPDDPLQWVGLHPTAPASVLRDLGGVGTAMASGN